MVFASHLVLVFFSYSFLGWMLETAVRTWRERRIVNPGFLTGPFVPIYGVGALSILLCTAEVRANPLLVFVVGATVATTVEFIAHLVLERTFDISLWDYTGRLGNLQGRVCLVNSLGFGICALVMVYGVDPQLQNSLAALPELWAVALGSVVSTVVLVDWLYSAASVLRLRLMIREFHGPLTRLRERIDLQLATLGAEFDETWNRRRARLLRRSRRVVARLAVAFPDAHTRHLNRPTEIRTKSETALTTTESREDDPSGTLLKSSRSQSRH